MLPLFAQELSTSCVAACLRMILAALGFSLTESEIRSRCGHSDLGMRLNQVAQGLDDLPVKVEYHCDSATPVRTQRSAHNSSAPPARGNISRAVLRRRNLSAI
ncbi:MAG: cysteine peptidase family C39 domain-containing protein [Blastocatellia bacterium]